MQELQNFVDGFGFGISVEKLADKAYRQMALLGHNVCIMNERYLIMDGVTYLFSKSRKNNRWIIKKF